jgi:hypothetical protein
MTHGPIAVGGRLCGQTLPALPAAIVLMELQQHILPMHAIGHDLAEANRALYKSPIRGSARIAAASVSSGTRTLAININ